MLRKNMKAAALLAFVLTILFSIPANAQTNDAKSLKERAAVLLEKGNYADALPVLEQLVILEPELQLTKRKSKIFTSAPAKL
jgi:hypothetical protein